MSSRLSKVTNGSVLFAGETAKAGRASLLAVGDIPSPKLFGNAATVRDVDRVAVITGSSREKACGEYKDTKGGSTRVKVTFTDLQVRVHDRRTGTSIARKDFPAPPKDCPNVVGASAAELSKTFSSSASAEEAIAWASKQGPG
jgi:type 1 fimbria pilin